MEIFQRRNARRRSFRHRSIGVNLIEPVPLAQHIAVHHGVVSRDIVDWPLEIAWILGKIGSHRHLVLLLSNLSRGLDHIVGECHWVGRKSIDPPFPSNCCPKVNVCPFVGMRTHPADVVFGSTFDLSHACALVAPTTISAAHSAANVHFLISIEFSRSKFRMLSFQKALANAPAIMAHSTNKDRNCKNKYRKPVGHHISVLASA